MNYGIHFNVGNDLHVHYTGTQPRFEKINFDDDSVFVLRYKRRGEQTDTIMPLAKIVYITED